MVSYAAGPFQTLQINIDFVQREHGARILHWFLNNARTNAQIVFTGYCILDVTDMPVSEDTSNLRS